jgi:metal-dependent amidase/aminoacylase/carboxypeptidase family protein
MLGLGAVNAIRETFKEVNVTRVHPIITEGGVAVNVIPETVQLESYVRGASSEAIVSESKKVNRALAGAALSIGAGVRVQDVHGYMPLNNDEGLRKLSKKVGIAIFGEDQVDLNDEWNAGSTDMGDLSCVMPVIHAQGNGGEGTGHGNDFRIVNPDLAYIDSTRYIAAMVCALLTDGGRELSEISRNYKPVFESHKAYFDFLDTLHSNRELVSYNGEAASVQW